MRLQPLSLPTSLAKGHPGFVDEIRASPYDWIMAQRQFAHYALVLHPDDTVAVLKRPVKPGDELLNGPVFVPITQLIGAGHKIALKQMPAGSRVIKYGQVIGTALQSIAAGEHVHTHNVGLPELNRDMDCGRDFHPTDLYLPARMRYFSGYARPDGRAGTRNCVAVISSVNCSASVSGYVRDRFRTDDFQRQYPNVDSVVAFTHKSGCAMDPGEPHKVLQRVLAGIARHPNISGFVLIGLGCEVNQVEELRRAAGLSDASATAEKPRFLNIQAAGGVRRTVEAGAKAVEKLLQAANELRRSPQPISKLIVAENCGGSDGNSGITANPALGVAADELVHYGATVVLAETPEIYGAEHLLTRRAATRQIGDKLLQRIRWWEEHARIHHCSLDNNPSPGNKAGGLTNIYEKSLGAVAKGGQSPLMAVYEYAEPIQSAGLCFMDTPGYDPVSMTGLVAGGCNIGVFTTGRGSVYGCKPAPCIKVATNTTLFQWMEEDMDLNAGTILDATETVDQVGRRIFEKIIEVASGEKTRSELSGIGDEEFAPWQLGPTF